MRFWESLNGRIKCRIVSASSADFFSRIAQSCSIRDVENTDALTSTFWVARQEYPLVQKAAQQRGDQLKIIAYEGAYWPLRGVLKRPILVTGMLILLFLSFYLPAKVLFVAVEGNIKVPATQILEKAETCGIRFGASRENVRSEKVKNTLLQALPQLQWACVNTSGCTAVISVQERNPLQTARADGVCDIVAARDGIITDATVYRGTRLCQTGQAVKTGQVLVSGYTDLGLIVKAQRAEADIFARTQRSLQVLTLPQYQAKIRIKQRDNRYSLLIGKKLINFHKDSGISPMGCGRMYSESYATLPGGFRLPLAFVWEQITYYEQLPCQDEDEDRFLWLQQAGQEIIHSEMIAGQILQSDTEILIQDDVSCLYGTYRCREMIGRIRNEEALTDYGERN